MQKRLHSILFSILFSCFMFGEIQANPNSGLLAHRNNAEQMKLIQNDVKVNDLDIEPIDTQKVKKNVVPDTKKESKKVMALFIRTMLAVSLCAIILYVILVFVKKYYGSAFVSFEDEEYYEDYDLSTPNNKQDALKSFLCRTK